MNRREAADSDALLSLISHMLEIIGRLWKLMGRQKSTEVQRKKCKYTIQDDGMIQNKSAKDVSLVK